MKQSNKKYILGKNSTDEVYATRGLEFDQWDGDANNSIRLGDPRQLVLPPEYISNSLS